MWYYLDKEFTQDQIDKYTGFVYIITNLIDNRQYVGKKLFKFRKVLYRKARNKVLQVDSDWLDYYGSNDKLLDDVKLLGKENFKREILKLCKSKSECNYYELAEQVKREVLFFPDKFYNSYIGTRISRKQLGIHDKKLRTEDTSS